MTPELATQALAWATAALMLLAAGAAAAVLAARSLFSASMAFGAMCACAVAALVALVHGDAALALGLFGAGIAPVMLLGGVLLSSRAVKPRARGWPWLSIAAAAAAGAAMMWAAPTIDLQQPIAAPRGGAPIVLSALIFVAVAACAALLGYGERGVLGVARKDRAR